MNKKGKTSSRIVLNWSSWFDLWHTHVDWDGTGNKSWRKRKAFLQQLFAIYAYANRRMLKNRRQYQSFCSINLDDSSQDAVYLHTKNPNANNYPHKIEVSNRKFKCSPLLIEYIEESGFKYFKLKNHRYLVVYNPKWGENLF